MKKLIISILLASLPIISHAAGYDANYSFWQAVEDQLCRQMDLIDSGIANGQLTRREAIKLRGEQQHAAHQVEHYRQHGYLSYDHQHELMSYLNHVTDRINRLKYNSKTKYHKHNKHRHNKHRHNNYNHNPFARNNWRNERNYRHSVKINRHDDPTRFHFRF